jgi:hypothetical protein
VGDDGRDGRAEELTTKESLEALDFWVGSLNVSGCPVGSANLLSVDLYSPEEFRAQQTEDGQANDLE